MTSPAQPPAAPAGWYPDPHGIPALRWWDGREWTAHLQPGASPTPPVVPAAAPTGAPLPGAHTVPPALLVPPGELAASVAERVTAPTGAARSAPVYSMQPVDAVSAQLGYTTPATPAGPSSPAPAVSAPKNRAVLVGAVSLLINPLLLCSVLAIVLGVRGLQESRQRGLLAIGLGAGGVATHVLFVIWLLLR